VATLGLTSLVACGPSEEVKRQLAELQAVSAEKDSLIVQVAENARLMSDISAELARVKAAGTAGAEEVPASSNPQTMLSNIRQLTTRIDESETRLAESQRRLQALTRETRGQQTRLAELQKTIEDFQATIENQKQTIAALTEQVNNLQQENVRLVAQTTELTRTVDDMTERENTVYYAIGTKDELLQRGVVVEQGGSRVLFVFGKRGKVLVPARSPDPSAFTRIHRLQVTTIPLPEGEYRMVSHHDLSALETQPNQDGEFIGEIRIADPVRFWASGPLLIIVRS
jgi:hypothetical protein